MTEGAETGTMLQTTSTPNKESELSRELKGIPNLWTKIPTVCLRSVFAPLAGYMCELCSQKFSNGSELVKHQQLHENPVSHEASVNVSTEQEQVPKHAPEFSFPCNMCDQSFATNQSLKRHKLLHVKDGRKCPKCGLIFCQLHNHVLFVPLPENGQDSTTDESLSQDPDSSSESSTDESVLEKSESFTDESEVTQESLEAESLLEEPGHQSEAFAAEPVMVTRPETQNPLPPPSHLIIPKEIPLPKLKRILNPQLPRCFRDDYPADYVQLHLPQKPLLPPPLKVFSPQRLTSAILEVRRNYEYILSKPRNVDKCKDQMIAYDVETVL